MSFEDEVIVCNFNDLKNGEMKQTKVGDTDVLLSRVNDKYYATSATCTHYGAPLSEGLLTGTQIMCPWHHACFDVKSGEKLEPPALDNLTTYRVRQDGQNILVSLPKTQTTPEIEPAPAHAAHLKHDPRLFVILGGGAAGEAAAENLRKENYAGRILMITRERRLPYDRPNLSKDYLAGNADPAWMPLRNDHFYSKHNVEVSFGREVSEVDATNKLIKFKEGDFIKYDALLLATGGDPNMLDVPGNNLEKVFTLRSYTDCDYIIGAINGATDAVVVGASFIGMEVAASLSQRGLKVTVVSPTSVPYEKTLGDKIGKMFLDTHTEKGVNFKLGEKVVKIEGTNKVEKVTLSSGTIIPADLVVVGMGIKPATNYLYGVNVLEDNSVQVDANLKAHDDLYAAGDIATYPSAQTGKSIRVEHWRVAQQHGRTAALAMLGKSEAYTGVPFFWTQQFDISLHYVGYAKEWDEIVYWGEPAKKDFIAFYVKDNQVLAAAALEHNTEMDAIEVLIQSRKFPSVEEIRKQDIDLIKLAKQN